MRKPDMVESLEAMHEYINTYADWETITAFNYAYEAVIEWLKIREKAMNNANKVVTDLLNQYKGVC